MSDSSRKVFSTEAVLALVTGKEGFDIKEIAGYVAGRSIVCDEQAKAVGVFAAAWLARWYPKFTSMIWGENQSWDSFVRQKLNLVIIFPFSPWMSVLRKWPAKLLTLWPMQRKV